MFNLKKVKKLQFEISQLQEEIKQQKSEISILRESGKILSKNVNFVGLYRDKKGILRSLRK